MEHKTICLTTEKQLRAYVHPLRQRILRTLEARPGGMTAKQLADALHIAPSSAGHHLAALEQIGVVELARTEKIHGLTAKYYRHAGVSVSLASAMPEALGARRAVVQQFVDETLAHCLCRVDACTRAGRAPTDGDGDIFTGTAHLTPADAAALHRQVLAFLQAHAQPGSGTQMYEYALLACRVRDEEENA